MMAMSPSNASIAPVMIMSQPANPTHPLQAFRSMVNLLDEFVRFRPHARPRREATHRPQWMTGPRVTIAAYVIPRDSDRRDPRGRRRRSPLASEDDRPRRDPAGGQHDAAVRADERRPRRDPGADTAGFPCSTIGWCPATSTRTEATAAR